MTKEEVRRFLDLVPGSRRAAQGVIVDNGDGTHYHYTGVIRMDPDLTEKENLDLAYGAKHEVIRMRDLRTPHDYLLRVRLEAIAASTRAIRTFRDRRARFEARGRRWTLTDYYNSQNSEAKRYIARLGRAQQRIVKAIPYGLAPINEANAVARKTLLGDVVMVAENLRSFYYFMNIAMYGPYSGVGPGDCVDAALIALRIMRGSESFDFDLDPRAVLPPRVEREIQLRTATQMEFTFGHEFAHLLEGHLDAGDASGDIKTYSHECEYAADSRAVLAAGPDHAAREAVARGAFDVLLFLQFLETSAAAGMLGRFSASDTHPRPVERIERLAATLGNRLSRPPGEIEASIEAIEQMAGQVGKRVEYSDRPDLLNFYGSMYLVGYTDRMKVDRVEF
ncbi:hypothetical protein [Sphingomonas faeni]|uniref:hypothetical protein n=1 Tax=Sphingomonas faeni TaxID=185950 RepID=UPI0033449069